MKVIVAINGTITAESMAFYALKYVQIQNQDLVLLHIENKKDDLVDVNSRMDRISTVAMSQNIQIRRVILQGSYKKEIKNYLSNNFVDIIFCSTRKDKNFINNSFSELLTKMNLNVDIAIIRIVNMNKTMDFTNIMLSIKEDRLSVKKFTFFTTMTKAYKAKAEIYSVSSMSKVSLSRVNIHEARKRLRLINYNLRHYTKLGNMMGIPLHIKHDFTNSETQSILSHIAKSSVDLVVIGAKRFSVRSFFKTEMRIERLMREASVNTIAYYPKED